MKEHISEIHEEGKNPSNLTFVITALLTRAVRLNTLLQFTMLRNNSKNDICDPSFYKKKHIVKVHESKKTFTCNLLM